MAMNISLCMVPNRLMPNVSEIGRTDRYAHHHVGR